MSKLLISVFLIVTLLLAPGCNNNEPTETCLEFATPEMIEWNGCMDRAPSILFFPTATPLYEGDMPATIHRGNYLKLQLPEDNYNQLRLSLSVRMNLIIDAFKRHSYRNNLHEVVLPNLDPYNPPLLILKNFYAYNTEGEGTYVTNPATGQKVLLIDVDYICFSNTALLPVLYK